MYLGKLVEYAPTKDLFSHPMHPYTDLGFGHLGEVGQQRLLDDVVNRHAGVQGGVGTKDLFSHPMHPYTESLLSAVPVADPTQQMERIPLEGEIPNPANPPTGCYFHTRCRYCKMPMRWRCPPEKAWGYRMR